MTVRNFNEMVTITVPAGLNGWVGRGTVTINGREFTFPIGVPTQVPKPVAEHIEWLIEMDEKENQVPVPESGCVDTEARQQITALTEEIDNRVPAGEGPHMMLVTDEDGKTKWEERTHYIAGEETVIVPETTVGNPPFITTPLQGEVAVGDTVIVNFNGTKYPCEVHYDEKKFIIETGLFFIALSPDGSSNGIYGIVESGVESAVVSIVKSAPVKTIDLSYLPVATAEKRGVVSMADVASFVVPRKYFEITQSLTYSEAVSMAGCSKGIIKNLGYESTDYIAIFSSNYGFSTDGVNYGYNVEFYCICTKDRSIKLITLSYPSDADDALPTKIEVT